jgi:hypothetical protein
MTSLGFASLRAFPCSAQGYEKDGWRDRSVETASDLRDVALAFPGYAR